MTTHGAVAILIGFLGFVLALAITAAVIWFVRAPLKRLLQQLIGDKSVADAAGMFVLVLLGLYGVRAALGYITQPQLSTLLGGLMDLLVSLAGVIQWIAYVAALLFIGYCIVGRKGEAAKE